MTKIERKCPAARYCHYCTELEAMEKGDDLEANERGGPYGYQNNRTVQVPEGSSGQVAGGSIAR